jgi:hypothetical protein
MRCRQYLTSVIIQLESSIRLRTQKAEWRTACLGLTDCASAAQVRTRHCQYYALLLERRGATFKGPEQPVVVAELMAELANVRLGWEWAATHELADELNQAADTLFRRYS